MFFPQSSVIRIGTSVYVPQLYEM